MRAALFGLLFIFCVAAPAAYATSCLEVKPVVRTSALAGQAFDPEGAVFPNAYVVITGTGREPIEIGTDSRGFFSVPGLAAGWYSLSVSSPGFSRSEAWIQIDSGFPLQLVLLQLAMPMSCDSRVCAVLAPAPAPVARRPECLAGPSPEKQQRKEAHQKELIERLAGRCTSGAANACQQLYRIARDDKDSSRRERALANLKDQSLLGELAKSAPDFSVRHSAVGMLTDEATLATLARDPESSIRAGAARRSKDGQLLAQAAQDKDAFVRRMAAENAYLTDAALLASLAETGDVYVRIAAIGNPNLNDSGLFGRLAGEGGALFGVRAAAVSRLSDAERLRGIATSAETSTERAAAIANPALTDEAFFAVIARKDTDEVVRRAALRRLRDPLLRTDVAPFVDVEAVKVLADPDRLADVAVHARDSLLRTAATQKIQDPELLGAILSRDPDEYVRYGAVTNAALTDQALLGRVAARDRSPSVRLAAALRLENRDLAQRVFEGVANAEGSGRQSWGYRAVALLADQELLLNYATTDRDSLIRRAAVSRIQDQKRLADIARSDKSYDVRVDAVMRLTDESVLRQIAKDDPTWYVRQAVEQRLEALKRHR